VPLPPIDACLEFAYAGIRHVIWPQEYRTFFDINWVAMLGWLTGQSKARYSSPSRRSHACIYQSIHHRCIGFTWPHRPPRRGRDFWKSTRPSASACACNRAAIATIMALLVDKHRPRTLETLSYHPELSERLRSLAASGDFPHLLIYGPSGAGKKTRITATLRALYGPGVEKIKIDSRVFQTTR
jgi:hypothetical protein